MKFSVAKILWHTVCYYTCSRWEDIVRQGIAQVCRYFITRWKQGKIWVNRQTLLWPWFQSHAHSTAMPWQQWNFTRAPSGIITTRYSSYTRMYMSHMQSHIPYSRRDTFRQDEMKMKIYAYSNTWNFAVGETLLCQYKWVPSWFPKQNSDVDHLSHTLSTICSLYNEMAPCHRDRRP